MILLWICLLSFRFKVGGFNPLEEEKIEFITKTTSRNRKHMKKEKSTYLDRQLPMHSEGRVLKRFGDRHIRILQISVLPNKSNGHFVKETFLAVSIA